MTEINITRFFNEACARDYSASVAEIGTSAGADTWRAAMDDAYDYAFITDDNRDEFKKFVRESGGWSDDEINAWTDTELNALCIQWIAGDMRESGLDVAVPDWDQYRLDSEAGQCAGRIFKGDDAIYFSLD